MDLIQQQDTQLDTVMGTVRNMKEVAITIGQEIDDQVGLLDEINKDVDNTQGRLDSALSRVKNILKKSQGTYKLIR